MRLTAITFVLCACVWLSSGDVTHIKATKAKLIGRLTHGKHHKRGVLSSVPPFKLGHDIPLVTHSVLKPVVVTYPPTASVSAVKVPLSHPLLPRYPVGVGHRVPNLPHPHYGLKFPHHHTKSIVLPKPDQHFHHHHHHVAPRPVVPVVPATPVVPLAAPTIARPIPLPSPPVVVPQPAPLPLPLQVFPRPLVPAAPAHPGAPAPVVAPAFSSFAPQFPYILRPGGAFQSSVFATYPRYPFSNYPSPLIPLSATAYSQIVPHQYLLPQGDSHDGVVVGQHSAVPVEPTPTLLHTHGEGPQPGIHLEPVQPAVHVHPGQPEIHFQSAQTDIHVHPEQSGIHLHPEQPFQPGVHLHSAQPDLHLQPGVHIPSQSDIHLQPSQPGFNLQPAQPEYHLQPGHTDVHLQSGHPDFHFQSGQPDVHFQQQPDYHLQPVQPDLHLQPAHPNFQFQSGQPDYNQLPNQPGIQLQPTQPTVDNNGWSPVPPSPSDVGNPDAHYPNDGHHHFTQEQGNQVFEQHSGNEQQYHDYQTQLQHHIQQQIEQAQYEQHINNQHQLGQEYGTPQQGGQGGQEYSQNEYSFQQQQPGAEYGVPAQGAEGRSTETEVATGDSQQRYHNHIPLGLQPPIDRPLDHFR